MEAFRREIFEQLGGLYYAIAAEQRTPLIMAGELKMAINRDWVNATHDRGMHKVSEEAHLIGVTIDALLNECVPASDAFSDFEKFFYKHKEQFSHALKKQIVETADTLMRILPTTLKRNECYERLKNLLYFPINSDETSK